MSNLREELAHEIASVIAASNLTQSEIARQMKVDTSSINRWVRGGQACPAYRVEKLAQVLDLNEAKADLLLKLALAVEKQTHDERAAMKSAKLHLELRELQNNLNELRDQIQKIISMMVPASNGEQRSSP